MDDKLEHLPPSVQHVLALTRSATHEALDALHEPHWLVLHGSAAHPTNWHTESSDLNLLIVLPAPVTPSHLSLIHDALSSPRRLWPLTVDLISLQELTSSIDVFPLKYLDIQRHHIMLHGPDEALATLEIAWDHLRLRLEQQLRSLLGLLRHTLPIARYSPEQLIHLLDAHLATFWNCLSALLFLRDGDWWISSYPALIDAAAERLDLDAELLHQLLTIRQRTCHPSMESLLHIMSAFHDSLARLATLVDNLDRRQELPQ